MMRACVCSTRVSEGNTMTGYSLQTISLQQIGNNKGRERQTEREMTNESSMDRKRGGNAHC